MSLRNIHNLNHVGDDLAVTFFTPDYRRLAEKLAGNLEHLRVPYMLFEFPAEDWKRAILRKPEALAMALTYARQAHCNRVVFLDADCRLKRWPHFPTTGDIAVYLVDKQRNGRHKLFTSGRVVPINLTSCGVRTLLVWKKLCEDEACKEDPRATDEDLLARAIAENCPTVSILPPQMAGIEHDEIEADADIVHYSQHDKTGSRPFVLALRKLRRDIVAAASGHAKKPRRQRLTG